jgi:putative hydrolase of the HAD superfamily
MIESIVFDLDDTLFPEQEFVKSGFKAVDDWVLKNYCVKNFYQIALCFFERGERGGIFDLTLKSLNIKYNPSTISELVGIYRNHEPKISLFDDAKEIIDHYKNRKKLGIITDGYLKVQRSKVRSLGIQEDFDAVIYSDLYGSTGWKPSPKPYQKAMDLLNCLGSQCIYVGDNPIKDFITAKVLGWRTVQVCRENGIHPTISPSKNHEADIKISSLVELKDCI